MKVEEEVMVVATCRQRLSRAGCIGEHPGELQLTRLRAAFLRWRTHSTTIL